MRIFQVIPLESFECMSMTGKRVAVVPGGRAVPLTFTNRQEYVNRTIHYRLHEMDRQVGEQIDIFSSLVMKTSQTLIRFISPWELY